MSKFRMYESVLNQANRTQLLGSGDGYKVFVAIRTIVGTVAGRFASNDSPEAALERAGKPKAKPQLTEMPAGTVFTVAASQYEKIQFGQSKGRWYVFPQTSGTEVEAATSEHAAKITELIDAAEKEDATIV